MRKGLIAILVPILVVGLAVAVHAAGKSPNDLQPADVQLSGQDPIKIKKGRPGIKDGMVSVMVRLEQPPLAALNPGKMIDVESPATQQHLAAMEVEHRNFETVAQRTIPSAQMIHSLKVVFGGVSMIVHKDSIDQLRSLPGVTGVYPDVLLQPTTERSPQYMGAPRLWNELGGQESAGEGVVVGIIDSGIWPENPSLTDPDPMGNPYPAPPASWTGSACDFGSATPGDVPFSCNNKLLAAQRLMATYDFFTGITPTEFNSARDDDGHGSHTATTAVGGPGASAAMVFGFPIAKVSGVAPRAHLSVYKVCGLGGCYGSDSSAAVQQAILDGVNVLNFSISGGGDPYNDAVSLSFLDAYDAGVFVAASAGNAGPGADTVSHREPWTTTVAANTKDRFFQGMLYLEGNGSLEIPGVSTTTLGTFTADVVMAADFDGIDSGDPDDGQCLTPFPADTFDGQIVICVRGTIARVEKGLNVLAGGAGGLILGNPTFNTIGTDKHYLPTLHIDDIQFGLLLDYMGARGSAIVGTITQGESTNIADYPGGPPYIYPGTAPGADVVAGFSSRGGPGQSLGISKPDITAPGVQILAGATPMPNDSGEASSFGAFGDYMSISGTSMSSPHIAGSAALLKHLHPDWTPGQIKSALMMTARKGTVKEDGVTPTDPFDVGSGHVNLRQAGSAGLTISDSAYNFWFMQNELFNTNYPSLYVPTMPGEITVSRTVRDEFGKMRTWSLRAGAPDDMTVTVPNRLRVLGDGEATFDITIDARNVPIGEVRHAEIRLTPPDSGGDKAADPTLVFPVTIVRQEAAVTMAKVCDPTTIYKVPRSRRGDGFNGDEEMPETTNCTITIQNTSFSEANVRVEDHLPDQLWPLRNTIVGGEVGCGRGPGTWGGHCLFWEGTLAGADPADVNVAVDPLASPFGYVPLAGFGSIDVGASDESITNFNVPSFDYAGQSWSQIGIVSNGYVVVGGGTAADVDWINSDLPNAAVPNNVLAPCWSDFNPSAGGTVWVNVLTDGLDDWTIVEWEQVPNYGDGELNTCQVWLGTNTDTNPGEDIFFTYGPDISDGDGGFMTVGAENRYGNRGGMVFFDGVGAPPEPSWPNGNYEVAVFSTPGGPGETHVINFDARARDRGPWQNCAEMTGDIFFGTVTACAEGEVLLRHDGRSGD